MRKIFTFYKALKELSVKISFIDLQNKWSDIFWRSFYCYFWGQTKSNRRERRLSTTALNDGCLFYFQTSFINVKEIFTIKSKKWVRFWKDKSLSNKFRDKISKYFSSLKRLDLCFMILKVWTKKKDAAGGATWITLSTSNIMMKSGGDLISMNITSLNF